jgi:hypothetical protein
MLCSERAASAISHLPKLLTSSDTALLDAACVATYRGSGCEGELAKRNQRGHVCELRGCAALKVRWTVLPRAVSASER